MNSNALIREHTLELVRLTEDLPTLPDRFLKIQHVLNDPNSGANEIAEIIQTDQATTVMVMKIASSPIYNPMNSTINKLSMAIARLGTNETADIALSMSLLYGFAIPAGISKIRCFWAHAYAVGLISKILIDKLPDDIDKPETETMFLAGLLHDIGRAVLGIRVDLSYFEKEEFATCGPALIEAEEKEFGTNHAEVGKIILEKWGMPDDVINIIAEHHQKTSSIGSQICSIANRFANQHMKGFDNIEKVHQELSNGLAEKAVEELVKAGLIPEEETSEPIDDFLVPLEDEQKE
ncbi:MAG: HDOD domain-containing protein [Mariprofundaceae bacterium]